EGRLFTNCGGHFSGAVRAAADCYPLIPADEYRGPNAQKRSKELEGKVGAPFEKEERYQQLSRRQNEIEEKLDLTKNQAPSQAGAADENDQTIAPDAVKQQTH